MVRARLKIQRLQGLSEPYQKMHISKKIYRYLLQRNPDRALFTHVCDSVFVALYKVLRQEYLKGNFSGVHVDVSRTHHIIFFMKNVLHPILRRMKKQKN